MRFYRDVFRIALPMFLQFLITSSVNLVDTLMIGQLGEDAIAAVGLSNQFFFVYDLVIFGLASGGAIFVSQFWGKRDEVGIERSLFLLMTASTVLSIPFLVLGLFCPDLTLRFFTPDDSVIRSGIPYLKLLTVSFPIFALSFCFSTTMKSTEHAVYPLISSVISMSANVFLNWVLIFGKLNFPELGILGAGIATLLARVLELVYLVSIMIFKRLPGNRFWRRPPELRFVKKFLHHTAPTVANEFAWSTGMTMYSVIYAHMGTDAIAAKNILSTVENFAFCFIFAISSATAVLVGRELGASRFESARRTARLSLKLTLGSATAIGAAILLLANSLIGFFDVGVRVRDFVRYASIVSALTTPLRAFNCLSVVGILRAGGDTRFSFLVETFTLWAIGIPLAAVSGLILGFPFPTVYAISMSDELTKSVILRFRYRSEKWLKSVVDGY